MFALPLLSKDVEGELLDFLVSFRAFFLDHRLVIYDLDLQEKQKSFVRHYQFVVLSNYTMLSSDIALQKNVHRCQT